MANINAACGFRPFGKPLRVTQYQAAGAYYPGDPVKLTSDGYATVAAASDALVGVAASYSSGAAANVLVWDHPDQLFVATTNDATVDAQTDFNLNYLFATGTASTAYKCSRAVLDSASGGATNSNYPFKVINYLGQVNNTLASGSSYVQCICAINNHQYKGSTGTLGT